MDRSFSSTSRTGGWPVTSKRTSLLGGIKGRTSTIGSSRVSMSGRSTQSVQVVTKTSYNVMETYGVSLPVLVTEALTFADRSAAVSVHISSNGWAWLVCGRRLLIWQYKQSLDAIRQRKTYSNPCRELTLPPSELAHRADLVWVYTPEGNQGSQVPACLAVSPEGTVRFWPSIAYEGTSIEDTTDLQGQECDSLVSLAPLGCMLATTTSSIVLLQPQNSGGRHCVTSHPLKPPQNLIKGIGRRMSSFFFGSMPSGGASEAKLVRVVVDDNSNNVYESTEWSVFVLTEHSLQKWQVSWGNLENLIFEFDVITEIRLAFFKFIWGSSGANADEQECWLLDIQPTGGKIELLAASRNVHVSQGIRFALANIVTDEPAKLIGFLPLKHAPDAPIICDEQELLQYRLLLTEISTIVYSPVAIMVYPVNNFIGLDEPDVIEIPSESGDRILGAALCSNIPVFFSRNNGLVSVTPSDYCANDFLNGSMMSHNETAGYADLSVAESANISVAEQDLEELTSRQDADSCLKAAFLCHASKKQAQCEMLIREMLPRLDQSISDVDNQLDLLVVKIARNLIDDIPAKDPRWSDVKSSGINLSNSTSLQINRQLEQKQKGLDLFFKFLHEMKFWERLSAVTSCGVVMYTTHVLAEDAERLVAAITLRKLQTDHASLIEPAIKAVLNQQHIKPSGGLTYQDLFYCEVSSIHRALQMLVKMCEEESHTEKSPADVAAFIAETNKVILAVLLEAIRYRESKAQTFAAVKTLDPGITEYVPWTAAVGPSGLREVLLTQRTITLKYGIRGTGDAKLRTLLYDQLLSIVDVLLDGSRCHLDSLKGSDKMTILAQQYQQERTHFIEPFVADEEYERATVLAEKYCDFHTLVRICDLTKDRERLSSYMEKFANQDFSQFLFGWYIQEQKPASLLQTGLQDNINHQLALSRFLSDHPSLSWIQQVSLRNFSEAANTLCALARDETELVERKKSMLSLGKLSYLASGSVSGDPETNHIDGGDNRRLLTFLDAQLNLIAYQEDLPDVVLSAQGYDPGHVRVFSPAELVQLYICNENETADEYTFKKTLEILDYVEDDLEKSELRHKIWCRAILCDSWVDADNNVPLQVVQQTVFFKVVVLIEMDGENLLKAIPPKETLLSAPELGELTESSSFQFLLLVAYEHIERMFTS